jgi:hypothetical protein
MICHFFITYAKKHIDKLSLLKHHFIEKIMRKMGQSYQLQ